MFHLDKSYASYTGTPNSHHQPKSDVSPPIVAIKIKPNSHQFHSCIIIILHVVRGFLLSSRPPYDSEILSLYLRVSSRLRYRFCLRHSLVFILRVVARSSTTLSRLLHSPFGFPHQVMLGCSETYAVVTSTDISQVSHHQLALVVSWTKFVICSGIGYWFVPSTSQVKRRTLCTEKDML